MAKTNVKPAELTDEEALAAKETAEQASAAKVDVLKDCSRRGHGGSYVYDPKTGKRTCKPGGVR